MKLLFFILCFFYSFYSDAQENVLNIKPYNDLGLYLKEKFYSDSITQSCYSGFHYVEIEFIKNETAKVKITGSINNEYETKIKKILTEDIWDKKFIKKCKKENLVIILDVFRQNEKTSIAGG